MARKLHLRRVLLRLAVAALGLMLAGAPPPPVRADVSAQPVPGFGPFPVPDQVSLPIGKAGLKGMVGHWWYVEQYGNALLDQYVRLGVTNVRLAVTWGTIEEVEGVRSFTRLDHVMDAFLERGIEVIPSIATIPVWASTNAIDCQQNSLTCVLDPAKVPAFEATMRELVARYPEVRRWEFWNEPEMWVGLRNPADYERWYRAFYSAAKSVDPRVQVAISTLTGWPFVQHLSPDLPMDAAAVHPYAGEGWGIDTYKVEELHTGLAARGTVVPLWITEYGWDSRWLDNDGRASMLRQTLTWMANQSYITVADYHMLHDIDRDRSDCCFGLLTAAPELAPKQPAYDAFSAVETYGWTPQPRPAAPRGPTPPPLSRKVAELVVTGSLSCCDGSRFTGPR